MIKSTPQLNTKASNSNFYSTYQFCLYYLFNLNKKLCNFQDKNLIYLMLNYFIYLFYIIYIYKLCTMY